MGDSARPAAAPALKMKAASLADAIDREALHSISIRSTVAQPQGIRQRSRHPAHGDFRSSSPMIPRMSGRIAPILSRRRRPGHGDCRRTPDYFQRIGSAVGQTRCIAGMSCEAMIMHGGFNGCVHAFRHSTSSDWTISGDSKLTGRFRRNRRRQPAAIGLPAPRGILPSSSQEARGPARWSRKTWGHYPSRGSPS